MTNCYCGTKAEYLWYLNNIHYYKCLSCNIIIEHHIDKIIYNIPSNTTLDTYKVTVKKTGKNINVACECKGFNIHGYCSHIRRIRGINKVVK